MHVKIEVLPSSFSICRVETLPAGMLQTPFCFAAKTDEEYSLVCETKRAPASALEAVHGWRAFRVAGKLDFSVIGLLAKLTDLLAREQISVFAVSTFCTDYILVQGDLLEKALQVLVRSGCQVERLPFAFQAGSD